MAIGINIEFKDPQKRGVHVPITGNATYCVTWEPIAERLGLFWLPEFSTGIPVPVEDLPEVIDEFRQLRADLVRNPPKSSWWSPVNVEHIIERIDMILEKLTELDPSEIAWIYIG